MRNSHASRFDHFHRPVPPPALDQQPRAPTPDADIGRACHAPNDGDGGGGRGNGGNGGGNAATFAELGTIFNDVTTRTLGGIDATNKSIVVAELQKVQAGVEQLIGANPEQFQGVAGIHAQSIVDQINLEIDAIKSVGSDPFAAKYINDVQRDLIDIVQGDDALAALASQDGHNGFAAVPDLLAPPSPFQGNIEQTDFMRQFAVDANALAERAVAMLEAGAAPGSPEVAQMVGDINAFVANASAFTFAQGGLYSARFDNEFADDGVNGTASRALISGLQTGNLDEVRAAAEVLAANAQDVSGNMLGIGDTPAVPNNGIPDHIDSFAVAGTVFNDATSKLIGGVYAGNQGSIAADLEAVQNALQQLIDNGSGQLSGTSALHAQVIVNQLGLEIDTVNAGGSGPFDATELRDIHRDIIDIVHGDSTLSALAQDGGLQGFATLPDTLKPDQPFHDNAAQSQFLKAYSSDAGALGQQAAQAVEAGDPAISQDLIKQIMDFANNADAFVNAQGGVYEARFLNELSHHGTTGTAADALIAGLQGHDAAAVDAAGQLLLETAADLADNQITTRSGGGGSAGHHRSHHAHAPAADPAIMGQADDAAPHAQLNPDALLA